MLVLGALSLASVMGMSGLAVEIGNAWTIKVQRQRVADIAALGSALAYKNSQSQAVLTATASEIVRANGLDPAINTTTAVLSADKTKVTVTVNSSLPLVIAKVLPGMRTTDFIPITNVAVASLVAPASSSVGCVMALSSGGTYGVTLTGGVSLTATGCSVATNSGVTVPWGTHIYAQQVIAGKTVDDPANNPYSSSPGIVTSPTANNVLASKGTTVSDPLAADSALTAAFAALGTVTQPITPTMPTGPSALSTQSVPTGTDWSLTGSSSGITGVTKSGNTWTAVQGTYNIRSITLGGGMNLVFQGTSTVTVSQDLTSISAGINFGNCACTFGANVANNSQPLTFGTGSVHVNGNMTLSNGAAVGAGPLTVVGTLTISHPVTVGAGAHKFGALSVTNNPTVSFGAGDLTVVGAASMSGTVTFGNGTTSIGGALSFSSGTLTFGVGNLTAVGGMTIGSGTIIVGNGTTWIGKNASGQGITASGGGRLQLGTGDLIIAGSFDLTGGGVTFTMGTGSVYVGRSNAGVGFATGTGVSVTTTGGTYFSVVGPMNIAQGTVSLGAADYRIGNDGSSNCTTMPSTSCTAIAFGNGNLTFGNGPFSANGNITVASNGSGNVLRFGATATHYINGSITDQGPIVFGAGLYLINGNFTNTNNGQMTGTDVSLVLKGSVTLSGSAGFTLRAPTTNASGGIPNVAIATKSTAATVIGAGSSNILSGVLYTPNSDLTISGGASVSGGGSCLSYIVSTITLNGGATAATSCSNVGSVSASGGSIALIQ